MVIVLPELSITQIADAAFVSCDFRGGSNSKCSSPELSLPTDHTEGLAVRPTLGWLPHLTVRLRASSNPGMDVPEEIRELPDVTIRVRETAPGFFEASFKPTDPLHISRSGYTLDTKRGLRGRTLTEVLDRAEANWRQNYPVS